MGNFDFLEQEFHPLAVFGKQAESYCLTDSNSSLIKVGMLGETIVDMIYRFTGLEEPYEKKTFVRLNKLEREEYIPHQVAGVLHEMRKARNQAVHDGFESVEMAKTLVRIAHSVCLWFAMAYGSAKYEVTKYVDPSYVPKLDASAEIPKTSDEEDCQLVDEALRKAEEKPKISKDKQIKRAFAAENQRPKTEAETRLLVDAAMRDAGWEVDTENIRYSKGSRPKRGRNMAIAEWPTNSEIGDRGYVDYALFVDEKMIGTVEAKAENKDVLTVLDVQCKDYSSHVREQDYHYCYAKFGDNKYDVPFTFATNGRPYLKQYETKSGIWSLDLRDPSNPPRPLHGWPSPEGLQALLEEDIESANKLLEEGPDDILDDPDGLNLRDYQIKAVKAAEKAVIDGMDNVLIAMATGTGKTRTALAMIYRFLSTDRFRRILFLVDRDTLGEQAEDAFKDVKIEQLLPLDEIYEVKGLDKADIDSETRISIATVQSMVRRIMYDEGDGNKPSVTDYDLVIVDEAHRGYILDKEMTEEESLYRDQREYQSKYRAVIEYFDAVKIALTATPALHTTQIFGSPAYRYTYREAVIDGWLVDHDVPHTLKTRLSSDGIHYDAGEAVTIYDPVTGELLNGAELEDEVSFDVDNFNKTVINENFDRAVLSEIADYIDPESPEEQGKTLIYAVDDEHADRIVRILKEIYSETDVDNDAIMKITAAAGGGSRKRVRELVRRFKNERFPSIAVTVDLLTTGIDVLELTTLVFMRRVKSRILFEQMLGRATRLCPSIRKTHFEIFDPVGVYEALEPVTAMNPVSVNPKTTIDQLIEGLDHTDEDDKIQMQIDSLVAKLQRKAHSLTGEQRTQVEEQMGFSLEAFVRDLRHGDPHESKLKARQQRDALRALDEVHINRGHAVVISDKPDELIAHTRDYGSSERPEDYLRLSSATFRLI